MHGSHKNGILWERDEGAIRHARAPSRLGESRAFALGFALIALLIAQASLFLHPTGFEGGPADDQRYLDAALDWFRNGPGAGTTHWALRAPLIGAIDLSFHLFGPGLDALLAVPRLFYGLFVAVTGAAMARWAGRRAAGRWLALIVTSPVLHEMATSVFPEIVELAMGALSLVAFLAARRTDRPLPRHGLMLLAGLALGTGVIARETLGFVAILYIWAAIFRPAGSRAAYASLALAMATVPVANILWLWMLTGDPLYRLHVNANHIHIFSAHLRGGVYSGSPFLNPDLASRWIPAGPTKLFWPVDPLIDFLISPRFGFVILGCALVALPWMRRGVSLRLPRGSVPLLIAIAIACYLTVTWIFTLRPQPRYYLPVAAAAQIGLALALAAMFARPDLRRRASGILALVLLGGAIPILVTRERGRMEQVAIDYIATHPGTYTTANAWGAGRFTWRAQLAGVAPPPVEPPPIGGYRIGGLTSKTVARNGGRIPASPGYRDVALIRMDQPLLERIVRPGVWRAVRIEQRVR